MGKVTVSGAARLAGISRQYFYKEYIRKGKLTVEQDDRGMPQIDTSELVRVFGGKLQGYTGDKQGDVNTLQQATAPGDGEFQRLEAEVGILREQLRAAGDRESWMQRKIDQLTDQLGTAQRLLEYKKSEESPEPRKRKLLGWLFGGAS